MSSLAFDKQGRSFKFHPRTRRLRVCELNNPGTRGTCASCYDDDGELLYVDAGITYLEFAKRVGDGFFRLNQCDENGVEIDEKEVPSAYVNVRGRARNQIGASGGDGFDPRDAVILHLTQSNQEFARTNAEVAKAALAQHAAVMMAAANLMREYTAAPPPPRISVRDGAREVYCGDDDGDDREDSHTRDNDDDRADDEPESPRALGWMPIYEDVKPHLPKIGMFLYAKIMEVLRGKTATPVAAPTPAAGSSADADTSAASGPGSAANGAAAGPSASSTSSSSASASSASASSASASSASAVPSGDDSGTASVATSITEASRDKEATSTPGEVGRSASSARDGAPRNGPGVTPTPEEMMRLLDIRSKLTPPEVAIAEHAIKRMSSDVLAQWLADLTAHPIDDAVRTVRSMIAQARKQQARWREPPDAR